MYLKSVFKLFHKKTYEVPQQYLFYFLYEVPLQYLFFASDLSSGLNEFSELSGTVARLCKVILTSVAKSH